MTMTPRLDQLPDELLLLVIENFPPSEAYQLAGLARTNRRLHAFVTPYLYKELATEALFWAARFRKIKAARKAIQEGARLNNAPIDPELQQNIQPGSYPGALVTACEHGSVKVARLIIHSFPHALQQDMDSGQRRCLAVAARAGRERVVTYLLKETDVDVTWTDAGNRTALHWACYSGNTHIVRKLLRLFKVDINAPDIIGESPLLVAIRSNRADVVEVLMRNRSLDLSYAYNPIRLAVGIRSYDIVRILLRSYNTYFAGNPYWVYSALQIAIYLDDNSMVELFHVLNDTTYDVNDVPSNPFARPTLLWIAIEQPSSVFMSLFGFKGLDVDSGWWRSPLIHATKTCKFELAQMLVQHGCNINLQDHDFGRTALMWAIISQDAAMVRLLLSSQEIDLSIRDRDNMSAVNHATTGQRHDIMELVLIYPHVDINIRDFLGIWPP